MATVKLFGAFRDMAGWAEKDIPAATLGGIKAAVAGEDARLADRLDHPSTLVIVNGAIAPMALRGEDSVIAASDEVAFGPPVSGG